jgi:small subunit ribosomal protein S1
MGSTEEQQEPSAEVEGSQTNNSSSEPSYDEMVAMYDESMRHLSDGEIVTGTVVKILANDVVIDVGYKSEGLVPVGEFTDYDGNIGVEVGDEVSVLLERTEDVEGHILLSKRKAEKMQVWGDIEKSYKAGEIIKGRVIDRIKGGLTVDVGIRAFLPGSLVDIRPIKYLESLKGEELEFKVISMDKRRNNVVLSRKAVLEKEFAHKKKETLEMLKEGIVLPGVVKNITDYGVFVDLGGIDGLLHITDISWGRVNHPSEHFSVGDEIDVVVLKFDAETERVSLGYKQTHEDPWALADKKYPLGSRVKGKVVSLVDYGAFIELEDGVEGLIHVSEMSWTKKVVNPSKILNPADEVEAIVSELDLSQRRISLSLRQAERNPWEELAVSHPLGEVIEGKVRNLTEFGAFVQITDEIDGLIHVSDMSWTKRIKHPSEVLNKGDDVKARITHIDVENQRVSLSIREFLPNEWENFVEGSKVGDGVTGRVVNVTDFGLFVDVYQGLEGLAHVSEIDVKGSGLEDDFSVGDWVSARILRIEEEDKKIGLTIRGVEQPSAEEIARLKAEYDETQRAHETAAEDTPEEESGEESAKEAAATDEQAGEADDTSDSSEASESSGEPEAAVEAEEEVAEEEIEPEPVSAEAEAAADEEIKPEPVSAEPAAAADAAGAVEAEEEAVDEEVEPEPASEEPPLTAEAAEAVEGDVDENSGDQDDEASDEAEEESTS